MSDPATTRSDGPAPRQGMPPAAIAEPLPWFVPALALLVVTFLVYIPVLGGGFVWDDYGFVIGNPIVEAGDGLRRFWLTREAKDYFPLTSSTFWVEWRLWGNHAAGYHIVNVLLHAASAIVLWRILRRLRAPGAWLAGLLFAVHPVAVASVAYISERKNTLSGIFFLLSLLAYLRYDEDSRRRWYFLAIFSFLLALFAKTSVVVLPFVLLLCAWWRRGRISRKDLLRSAPFFGLAVALGLMTIWFQWQNAIHGENVRPEHLASRIAAAGWIFWFYFCKVLLPTGLCAVYPRWDVPGASALAFLPLALLAAGVAWLWLRRKRWGRAPLFAAAYFLIALLPVLGFVAMLFMGLSLVADHLQYLAMIGVVAFAAGILRGPAALGWEFHARGRVCHITVGALAAAACVIALSAASWHRAWLYADEERLWVDNISKNPDGPVIWHNLGMARLRTGDREGGFLALDQAVALVPNSAEAWYERANAHARAGDYELALRDYTEVVRLNPGYALAYNNRGNVHAARGQYEQAAADYGQVIELKPYYAEGWFNRGFANARLNRFEQALADFERATELKPNFAEAWYQRGNAWNSLRRPAEAVRDYSSAIALRRGFADAYKNRAIAFFGAKEYDKAQADVKKCRELGGRPNPEFVKALTKAAGRKE